jgi:hypothetical protein
MEKVWNQPSPIDKTFYLVDFYALVHWKENHLQALVAESYDARRLGRPFSTFDIPAL